MLTEMLLTSPQFILRLQGVATFQSPLMRSPQHHPITERVFVRVPEDNPSPHAAAKHTMFL